VHTFEALVDDNSASLLLYNTLNHWLGLRLELIGSVVTVGCTTLAFAVRGVIPISPAELGMAVMWYVCVCVWSLPGCVSCGARQL
jgi:hypothetical protein